MIQSFTLSLLASALLSQSAFATCPTVKDSAVSQVQKIQRTLASRELPKQDIYLEVYGSVNKRNPESSLEKALTLYSGYLASLGCKNIDRDPKNEEGQSANEIRSFSDGDFHILLTSSNCHPAKLHREHDDHVGPYCDPSESLVQLQVPQGSEYQLNPLQVNFCISE